MGRVYTAEAIRHETVPLTTDAHYQAAAELTAIFSQQLPSGLAQPVNAFVYGSVADGTANIRSDVDFAVGFMLKDDDSLAPYYEAQALAADVARKHNVYVELKQLMEVTNVIEGADPFFADCLGERAVALGQPTKLIPYGTRREDSEALFHKATAYVGQKLIKFVRPFDYSEDSQHAKLQRALEAPKAIARKAVYCLVDADDLPEGFNRNDLFAVSELSVQRIKNKEYYPAAAYAYSQIVRSADWLIKANDDYTDLLHETLANTVTTEDYEQWLKGHYYPVRQHAAELCHGLLKQSEVFFGENVGVA
jgi:hypothetical protein